MFFKPAVIFIGLNCDLLPPDFAMTGYLGGKYRNLMVCLVCAPRGHLVTLQVPDTSWIYHFAAATQTFLQPLPKGLEAHGILPEPSDTRQTFTISTSTSVTDQRGLLQAQEPQQLRGSHVRSRGHGGTAGDTGTQGHGPGRTALARTARVTPQSTRITSTA